MITCIREVRRAKGMSLLDVAVACTPPTTAQTIGRLETGTRTVSLAWLNRIAGALGVAAADLVRLPDQAGPAVVAELDAGGARAPRSPATAIAPPLPEAAVAVRVRAGVGDYRAGDLLWCERLGPERFAAALNRDAVVPRPAGRFAFGRLIAIEGAALVLLPPAPGARPDRVESPPWLAVASQLVRRL